MESDPLSDASIALQRHVITRPRHHTRSQPRFTNVKRDSSNDEISELCLGIESGRGLGTSKKSIFPTSWRLFKPGSTIDGQQRRREEAQARYQDAKYQMVIKSRKMMDAFIASEKQPISASSLDSMPDSMNKSMEDDVYYGDHMESNHPSGNEGNIDVDSMFADSLMMPEFLNEIPPDFEKDWYCKPFPDGIRCTLIARAGETQARDGDGNLVDKFQSVLPCGSSFNTSSSNLHCTILDCIQVEAAERGNNSSRRFVYFVLDMMAWNGKFFYNSSAELRSWMAQSWINETEGLNTISNENRSTRNDRLILTLPIFDTDINGLEYATTSPLIISINLPKAQFITKVDQTAYEYDDSEEHFHHDHASPSNHFIDEHSVEYKVEGVMFYFKEMDYINEQTPAMCLLPLPYAKTLIDDIRNGKHLNMANND
jgi:hypothetical protein